MYLKEKRGDDNFMCSWGAFLHYYNAGIFTCFPPTYDVYSVVIVITTGAGGGWVVVWWDIQRQRA